MLGLALEYYLWPLIKTVAAGKGIQYTIVLADFHTHPSKIIIRFFCMNRYFFFILFFSLDARRHSDMYITAKHWLPEAAVGEKWWNMRLIFMHMCGGILFTPDHSVSYLKWNYNKSEMHFYKCTNPVFIGENQVEKTPPCAYSSNAEGLSTIIKNKL